MPRAALLSLVARYPHPRALARRVGSAPLFAQLHGLEQEGLVSRRRGLYRLTVRGSRELAFDRALGAALGRALRW